MPVKAVEFMSDEWFAQTEEAAEAPTHAEVLELQKAQEAQEADLHLFTKRLYEEWLPAFCNDPGRNHSLSGFKELSIKITNFDAGNFLRAINGGLVNDSGGGRYRCAKSSAFEQLFWTGSKSRKPRPITLWVEPVVTIATIARLSLDFGWPTELLGMQSKGGAFDFAVFGSGPGTGEIVAGEVKKTKAELDEMVLHLLAYSRAGATMPSSGHAKSINSFRKWVALLTCRAPLFWAVGPGDYTHLFEVRYGHEGTAMFTEVGLDMLSATGAHGIQFKPCTSPAV